MSRTSRMALLAGATLTTIAACSSDDPINNGAGAGGSTSTTTTSTATTTTGAGGQGGDACAADIEGECGACMETSCCDAAADCQQDPACWACVTGVDGDACESSPETHERVNVFLVCRGGACSEPCIGASSGECEGLLDGLVADACAGCLEASCCDEVAACHGNDICWVGCFTEHDPETCHSEPDGHALFHALGSCSSQNCDAECAAPSVTPACDAPAISPSGGACVVLGGDIACNPVTNEGCDAAAGEACDLSQGGGFTCYPPPPANDKALCEACGAQVGWCQPGHVCVGTCARFCCDDADCGAGVCDMTVTQGALVGACVEAP